MYLLPLLLLLVPLALGQSTYQLSITPSSNLASATTTYTFQLLQQQDLTLTPLALLQVHFPLNYQSLLPDGNYTCTMTSLPAEWIPTIAIPSIQCNVVGMVMSVTGMLDNLGAPVAVQAYTVVYRFVVQGIANPIYTGATDAFTGAMISTQDSSVLFRFQTQAGLAGIMISDGVLGCTVTATPTTTTSTSLMVVTVTPGIVMPSGSFLVISMQRYWPSNVVNTTNIISNASCQPLSNASASIQCTMSIQSSTLTITVTNLVAGDVYGGVRFTLGSMINPGTVEPQGSIDIVARKNATASMARCTGVKLTSLTPINLLSASYIVSNYSVNANTTAYLTIRVNSFVTTTDSIELILPFPITIATYLQRIVITNNNFTDYAPVISTGSQSTTVTTRGAYATPGSTLELQLMNVRNPPSEATTTGMMVSIRRNGYEMERLGGSGLGFKARKGVITGVLAVGNTQVGAVSDYTFTATLANQISSSNNSVIQILLPSAYASSITANTTCTPACVSLSAGRAVFLASSLGSLSSSVLDFTVQINSLVNPLQIGLTSSFVVRSLYNGSNAESVVDESSLGLTANLTARLITQASVSASSSLVYDFPVTYTLTLSNNNPIPAFSALQVTIPSTITIQQLQPSCSLGPRSLPCTYDPSTLTLTLSPLSPTAIPALSLPPVTVANLYNPPSTRPTASFRLHLVNPFGQVLEYTDSGLIFTATSPTKFTTLSVIPSSYVNSASSTSMVITFSLNMRDGYVNNSLLVVSYPMGVGSIGCVAVSANLLAVACTRSASVVKVRLVFGVLTAGEEVSVRLEYYTNYQSIEPYNIGLVLYTSASEQFKIVEDAVTLVNTQLSPIVVNLFSFGTRVLAQPTNLALTITPAYSGPDLNQFLITLPAEFTLSSPSCPSMPSLLICSPSGNSFRISRPNPAYSWTMPLQVTLSGLTAPSFTPSSPLTIETRSSSGYLLSRDTSVIFSTACTLPCRTCAPGDPTLCTGCYSNAMLVSGQVMLSSGRCVAACANRLYFNNATGQCDSCSSSCQLCLQYDYCTTCPLGRYLYRVDNTCMDPCPFGYYGSVSTCERCTTGLFCASCSNSFSCLTCLPPYFLYSSLCLPSCPAPITIPNSILNSCDPCPTNCTKCNGSVTLNLSSVTCTQCLSGYLLDTNSGRCSRQCPVPGTLPSGGQCVGCTSPCTSCAVYPSNCTACDVLSLNRYFLLSRCLSSCPQQYYNSNISYTCQPCLTPCLTCTSISINTCISCIADHYILNTTCLPTCPSTHYPRIYECVACVAPCLSCYSQLECKSCVPGKFLYFRACLDACEPGMTVINGNECLVCDPQCKTCSSATYCTSCFVTNYLYNGTCYTICPNGTYRNLVAQACLPCDSPCEYCSGSATYCVTCLNKALFIDSGACVPTCSGSLIGVNGICVACASVCATCIGQIDNCIRCQPGLFYISNGTLPSCVSNCSAGYLLDNPITSNRDCLPTCPPKYHSVALNTLCQPCPSSCTSCPSSTCTECDPGYFLSPLDSTCWVTCPPVAPFPLTIATSRTCELCNRSECASCEGLDSCGGCVVGLLVWEGVTVRSGVPGERKVCVGGCGLGQVYSGAQLLCVLSNSTNNNTNNTNNSSNGNNTVTPTNNNGSGQIWPSRAVPNYLFSYLLCAATLILLISRSQVPATNLKLCLLALLSLCCLGSLAHVLYYQGTEIIKSYIAVGSTSSAFIIGNSVITISLDNPTTVLGLTCLGVHIVGMLVLVVGLLCTRDYSLVAMVKDKPVVSCLLGLVMLVQYKCVWLLSSGLFGLSMLQVKYCKQATVRLLKLLTVIAMTEFSLQIAYSVYVIVLSTEQWKSRLLLSGEMLPGSVGYLHPYIEMAVLGSLGVLLSIAVMLAPISDYFLEPTAEQKLMGHNKGLRQEINQSMDEMISEKQAAHKRFSSAATLKDIDEEDIISIDEDHLYDFGTTNRADVTARDGHQGSSSGVSNKSKKKQVETADIDIQANLDQLLIPSLDDITEQDDSNSRKLLDRANGAELEDRQDVVQQSITKSSRRKAVGKQQREDNKSYKSSQRQALKTRSSAQKSSIANSQSNGLQEEQMQQVLLTSSKQQKNSIERKSKSSRINQEKEKALDDGRMMSSKTSSISRMSKNRKDSLNDKSQSQSPSRLQTNSVHIQNQDKNSQINGQDRPQTKNQIKSQSRNDRQSLKSKSSSRKNSSKIAPVQEQANQQSIVVEAQVKQQSSPAASPDKQKQYQQALSAARTNKTRKIPNNFDQQQEQVEVPIIVQHQEVASVTHKRSSDASKQISQQGGAQQRVSRTPASSLEEGRKPRRYTIDSYENDQLISSNMPSQYRPRLRTAQSEPFQPFMINANMEQEDISDIVPDEYRPREPGLGQQEPGSAREDQQQTNDIIFDQAHNGLQEGSQALEQRKQEQEGHSLRQQSVQRSRNSRAQSRQTRLSNSSKIKKAQQGGQPQVSPRLYMQQVQPRQETRQNQVQKSDEQNISQSLVNKNEEPQLLQTKNSVKQKQVRDTSVMAYNIEQKYNKGKSKQQQNTSQAANQGHHFSKVDSELVEKNRHDSSKMSSAHVKHPNTPIREQRPSTKITQRNIAKIEQAQHQASQPPQLLANSKVKQYQVYHMEEDDNAVVGMDTPVSMLIEEVVSRKNSNMLSQLSGVQIRSEKGNPNTERKYQPQSQGENVHGSKANTSMSQKWVQQPKFGNKGRGQVVDIEYDDASHYNQAKRQELRGQEQGLEPEGPIIYHMPSQDEHHDRDEQQNLQAGQQGITGASKKIAFIEDLQQLSEYVKTPIRMPKKPQTRYKTVSEAEARDSRPSQYLKPTGTNSIEFNPDLPTELASEPHPPKGLAFKQPPKANTRYSQNKTIDVIYQQQDQQYQEGMRRASRQGSSKQAREDNNPVSVELAKYKTIRGFDERTGKSLEKPRNRPKNRGSEMYEEKPSAMLRGSFKKIGEMLMK